MTEGQINEFSRALGALQATVAGLTSMWERNDREATDGRRRLHAKVDEMKTELTRLSGRVETIGKEVAEMKPSVDTFDAQHQQGIGSKKTLALIWAALVGIVGATAGAAVEIVHLLWPHNTPPHP